MAKHSEYFIRQAKEELDKDIVRRYFSRNPEMVNERDKEHPIVSPALDTSKQTITATVFFFYPKHTLTALYEYKYNDREGKWFWYMVRDWND